MKITIIAFIKKELSQILRDPRMKMLLFVMPIIQMTIFGLALSMEIRNIKLASIFTPSDILAEKITESFFASGWFLKAENKDFTDPIKLIESGTADAVMIMPAGGLTKAVERGDGKIQLLINSLNTIKARSIELYAKKIISKMVAKEYPKLVRVSPLVFDIRVLYNPSMESSLFLVPGVMSMIVCIVTIILTAMSFTREKEMGTIETIISAPLNNFEIIWGKALGYIFLGFVDVILVILVGYLVFNVPIRGPLWQLGLASLVFVLTTVAVGMLISTIAETQQQAMLGGFIFLFPAILMSGIMFPVENMPKAIIFLAYLNPIYYFLTLLRNIMLKGGNLHIFWVNIGVLLLMWSSISVVSFKRFRQTLN
jgi:drug efflux transport system permease protein